MRHDPSRRLFAGIAALAPAQRLTAMFPLALIAACAAPTQSVRNDGLERWAGGAHRTPANVARDPHRHPVETLRFLRRARGQRDRRDPAGQHGLLHGDPRALAAREGALRGRRSRRDRAAGLSRRTTSACSARLKAEPALYDRVAVTRFNADRHEVAPLGSADFVLTFRNLHNWMERGEVEAALRAFHRALKPGGVLGVVDHRGRDDLSQQAQMKSGYVRQDIAIELIERAGFRLAATSEVNANPRDMKDHPEGVWTLPPTYRLKDRDRAKYQAIGESDRFTLKFVKR